MNDQRSGPPGHWRDSRFIASIRTCSITAQRPPILVQMWWLQSYPFHSCGSWAKPCGKGSYFRQFSVWDSCTYHLDHFQNQLCSRIEPRCNLHRIIAVSCLCVQSLTRYSNTSNPTYDTLASAVWSNVELNVGVICICMPAFRRFWRILSPNSLVQRRIMYLFVAKDRGRRTRHQSARRGAKGKRRYRTVYSYLLSWRLSILRYPLRSLKKTSCS